MGQCRLTLGTVPSDELALTLGTVPSDELALTLGTVPSDKLALKVILRFIINEFFLSAASGAAVTLTSHCKPMFWLALVYLLSQPALLPAQTQKHTTTQQASPTKASTPLDEKVVRRLISLVEYIGGDYTAAVVKGKIVSADEYTEMQEFSASALREFDKLAPHLPPDDAQDLRSNLVALQSLIAQKVDVAAIRALTDTVKNRVIDSLALPTAPKQRPDRTLAIQHYATACASCHGADGGGDGPAGKGLEPPPRDFHEQDVTDISSPFKFYNTLVLGVEGTAMVSYAPLFKDGDLWSLAFHTSSLRHAESLRQYLKLSKGALLPTPEEHWNTLPKNQRLAMAQAGLSLALLARRTDNELRVWLKGLQGTTLTDQQIELTLQALRLAAPYLNDTPLTAAVASQSGINTAEAATTVTGDTSPTTTSGITTGLTHTKARIAEAQHLFANHQASEAETALLDAYLEGFEALETPLASRNRALVTNVEAEFIAARAAARQNDTDKFNTSVAKLEELLVQAESTLLQPSDSGTWAGAGDFFASFVIILREGFEAFLVIAAILALLAKSGAAHLKRYIHLGWITAVAAGFASYFAFTKLFELSGIARETTEAICTGLAAVMLFYVSFWLLNKTERNRWDEFLKKSTNAALAARSSLRAFFVLAFIAVYREAAETVLFYSALSASAQSTTAVVLGFVAGCIVLFAACWLIMRYGLRLPLRTFFLATSTAMIFLAVVLAGKAVHELIEAGFINPTMISAVPTIDALGIYPNWETLGTQLVAIAAATLLALLSLRTSPARS